MKSIHRSALAVLTLAVFLAACSPDATTPFVSEPPAPAFDNGMVGPGDRAPAEGEGTEDTALTSDTTSWGRGGMVGPSD